MPFNKGLLGLWVIIGDRHQADTEYIEVGFKLLQIDNLAFAVGAPVNGTQGDRTDGHSATERGCNPPPKGHTETL